MYTDYKTKAPLCGHCGARLLRIGPNKKGKQRYRCPECGRCDSDHRLILRSEYLKEKRRQDAISRAKSGAKTLAELFQVLDPAFHAEGTPLEGYVRMTEAARRLGVSRQRIHQKVARGRLEAMELGGTTWVKVI